MTIIGFSYNSIRSFDLSFCGKADVAVSDFPDSIRNFLEVHRSSRCKLTRGAAGERDLRLASKLSKLVLNYYATKWLHTSMECCILLL